ncbi:hypothetical protein [Salaquimonas pukyongi]|nr:hypothetical protein [Salaquimonas pukyongi]
MGPSLLVILWVISYIGFLALDRLVVLVFLTSTWLWRYARRKGRQRRP